MAYDKYAQTQDSDPLSAVSDKVLDQPSRQSAGVRPKTYADYNRSPSEFMASSRVPGSETYEREHLERSLAPLVSSGIHGMFETAQRMMQALQRQGGALADEAGKQVDLEMYERGLEPASPEDRVARMHAYMKGAAPHDAYAPMDPATLHRMYPNMSPEDISAYARAVRSTSQQPGKAPVYAGPHPTTPHATMTAQQAKTPTKQAQISQALAAPGTRQAEKMYLEEQIRALRAQGTPQARQQAEQLARTYEQNLGDEARRSSFEKLQAEEQQVRAQKRRELDVMRKQQQEQEQSAKQKNLSAEQMMDQRIDPFIFAQEGTARTKKKGQTSGGVGGMTDPTFAGAMHHMMSRDETSPALQDLKDILGSDVSNRIRREDPATLQHDKDVLRGIDKIKTPKDETLRDRVFKDEVALNHELTSEGIQLLKNAKIPATLGNIYVTHFMGGGPNGAKFIASAMNPKRAKLNAAQAFPTEAKANPEFFKKGRTIKQVYDNITDTMRRRVAQAGVSNPQEYLTKDYSDLKLTDLPKQNSLLAKAERRLEDAAPFIPGLAGMIQGMKRSEKPAPKAEPAPPAEPVSKKTQGRRVLKALSNQRARNKTRRD